MNRTRSTDGRWGNYLEGYERQCAECFKWKIEAVKWDETATSTVGIRRHISSVRTISAVTRVPVAAPGRPAARGVLLPR